MKTAGILLAAIGGLILLLSGWYAVEAFKFFANSESTSGVVVEHKFTGGLNTGMREVGSYQTKTNPMYAPVVKFATAEGKEIKFQANWSEGAPPAIGSWVAVRFPQENPEDARIAGIASLYGGAGILLVIGGIFFGAGVLVLRKGRNQTA